MEAYTEAVCRHIASYGDRLADYSVDTVYFGGGTPTLMEPQLLVRMLDTLRKTAALDGMCEITAECNPATADQACLRTLRGAGFNRLSIGAQSFDDGELSALGRLHCAEDVCDTVALAREAGFENISLDLMYGIPRQTHESWRSSLTRAIALDPCHISAYGLKVEERTPFGQMGARLVLPSEEQTAQMYSDAVDMLGEKGIAQYEISNFAREGRESRHNLKYWNCHDYVGFGAAAHSCFEGERYAAPEDVDEYTRGAWLDLESSVAVTAEDMETEYVMLRLRLRRGLVWREYAERFGRDAETKYLSRIQPYLSRGYMEADGEGMRLTPEGMLVSNYILSEILDV